MVGIELKLMLEAEGGAGQVVVVIDKMVDFCWDCDAREASMGGGIYAPGGAICWVSFTGHILCKDMPGGGGGGNTNGRKFCKRWCW